MNVSGQQITAAQNSEDWYNELVADKKFMADFMLALTKIFAEYDAEKAKNKQEEN